MWRLTIFLLTVLTVGSCSGPKATTSVPEKGYSTSFPHRDMSKDLSHLFKSVKRISSTAFYNTYSLASKPAVYNKNISIERLNRLAVHKTYTNHSSAGTALVLSASSNRVLLITCAHVITFPDTVIQYYQSEQSGELRPIKFLAYKDKQTNLLIGNQTLGYFDVIAVDTKKDLALLSLNTRSENADKVTPMDFPAGNLNSLKLGSFVYALGYPKGYKMVTHAIVGDVAHPPFGYILIDAPFNRGFSGGVVMALKGQSQKMEWIGMANSSSATAEYILGPDKSIIKDDDLNDVYHGPTILEQQNLIDYGITKVIPIDVIQDFIRRNIKRIHDHGFSLPEQLLR